MPEFKTIDHDPKHTSSTTKSPRTSFPESYHCQSRLHCHACRNNSGFRQTLVQAYGPFDCPLNLPIGKDTALPTAQLTPQPHPTCLYATILDDPFHPHRPCKGRKVKCTNPDCPADFWYEAGCNEGECRFFENPCKEL
ncbi:MAG: hypothetical protein JXA52_06735 [Planctomycetes bacterium]|nr:hypothetical protein [Planctomycetota bacterium]